MKKTDTIISVVIGFLIGVFFLVVLKNIGVKIPYSWLFLIIFPPLVLFGMFVATLIGRKFLVFWQAAKFILVGILNTFVDLGVLNFLILISGIASGLGYSVFKGISFIVAVINSYFWNKFWTFKKPKMVQPGKEFLQFFIVSLIGFGINVGIASLVVNVVGSQFGLSEKIWANVGAIIATFCGMTWNFLGYKFIVFK